MLPTSALLLALVAALLQKQSNAAELEHFEKSVRPLLAEHCGKCHIEKDKGGLKLTNRAELLTGGDTGPSVVPGDAAKSLLVKALKYDGELKMPPTGKLKPHEIEAVTKWVNAGAAWPSSEVVAEKPKNGPLFTEEQKKFWAFQPVLRPEVPKEINPVDHFINAKLKEHKLTPAPVAEKRALIRRVTFDLIGLPPTPEEVAEFEKDSSPKAFEKVVDRLLKSPHYGERWARHWLDVARYADSNGMDENTAFGNAWKYRDAVVRSFNDDQPIDQFFREQIAADLLPPLPNIDDQRSRQARLGFLSIGPKLLAEPDKQKMLLDIADEQLDTVGKAMLGLTLGCARCHDHKFDPLPTRDYYSLLGVFTSTRTMRDLNTVAKAYERKGVPDTPQVAALRIQLEEAKKELAYQEAEFAKVPMTDKAKREEIHAKAEEQRAKIKKIEPTIPPEDSLLGVQEGTAAAYGTNPRNLKVQIRGNYVTPGEEAPPVFPRIINGEFQAPFVQIQPNPNEKAEENKIGYGSLRVGSGRFEFANWIASPGNPLTARVFVNRLWRHHFGEGIVRTPDNFGRLGERPTLPELLDYLASEFISPSDDGVAWSVKRIHKMILMSDAYRRASEPNSETDPDNRWLAHYPQRRLDAESSRDAMLFVAGTLDRKFGGALYTGPNLEYVGGVNTETNRRSLYIPVIRANLFDYFQTFDFPDPGVTVGHRATTTVPSQALYWLNNPFVGKQSEALAKKLIEDSPEETERIQSLYSRAFQRKPSEEELHRIAEYLSELRTLFEVKQKDPAKREVQAWASVARAIFASNEFARME